MFVGVVVENFHRCREEQEKEEKIRRAAKRAVQMEKKRKRKPLHLLTLTHTHSLFHLTYPRTKLRNFATKVNVNKQHSY